MSTYNGTLSASAQRLVEQRLDAIDEVLRGLLPRQERIAAVSQVESQVRALAAGNPEFEQSLIENCRSPLPVLTASGHAATACSPSKKRSRLAITAGTLGLVSLLLLMTAPFTFVLLQMMGDALGEEGAIGLMGSHLVSVVGFALAAVVLGIVALVKLNRNREALAGHGWAITGLCTAAVPLLLGGLSTLFIVAQLGMFQTAAVQSVYVSAADLPTPMPPPLANPNAEFVIPTATLPTPAGAYPDAVAPATYHPAPSNFQLVESVKAAPAEAPSDPGKPTAADKANPASECKNPPAPELPTGGERSAEGTQKPE